MFFNRKIYHLVFIILIFSFSTFQSHAENIRWVPLFLGDNIISFTPLHYTTSDDRDGDGIPNSVEIANGSDPDNPNSPVTSGNLDDDRDGIVNGIDDDIDGDGVINSLDIFPRDASESLDSDHDGIGDNTDTPVTFSSNITIDEDTFNNPVYLESNDIDHEVLTYTITTFPTHGTLNGVAPNLTYTPDKDYAGTDILQFQVQDATHISSIATITFTINNLPEHNGTVAFPFPQHIDYGVNTIIPNQYPRSTMDNHVKIFYTQWKSEYLVDAGIQNGQQLYRIALGKAGAKHNKTVSEGQGYGMIISTLMAGYDSQAQSIFDGLWHFSRLYPSGINTHLMTWQVPIGSSGNDSAFDGDADIAYALLMADKQWGSNGSINYVREAIDIIEAIRTSTIGTESKLPMLGDWVDKDGTTYNQYTNRPSDFMPSHFQTFSTISQNNIWMDIANTSRQTAAYIQTHFSDISGLLPDFIMHESINGIFLPKPAQPNLLESVNDGDYYYNACRVPLRYGMDALFYHNSISINVVTALSTWISDTYTNPYDIRSGFQLDGTPLNGSNYFSTVFVAPMGVAAMSIPSQQHWLNQIYEAVKDTHEDYYEDSINLLSLLVMTGNFWYPEY